MKKKCLWCKKILVRKTYNCKRSKSGLSLEGLISFSRRIFCNQSCSSKFSRQREGYTIWTKEKLIKKFSSIKNENKWTSTWLEKNHHALFRQLEVFYHKGYWTKFVKEMGGEPIYNKANPKRISVAKLLLKYWKEELDYKARQIIEYDSKWGIPGTYEGYNRNIDDAVETLKKTKIIRLIKKGTSAGRKGSPSQYIFLKAI